MIGMSRLRLAVLSCSIFAYSLERSSSLVQLSLLHDLSTLFSALKIVLTLWDVSRRWFILTMDFSVQCINASADNRYWLMQILANRYVSAHVHCWYLPYHASWEWHFNVGTWQSKLCSQLGKRRVSVTLWQLHFQLLLPCKTQQPYPVAHVDCLAMPIGNLTGSYNKVNAGGTRMHVQQLIASVVDNASTIVQEDVDGQPSTIRHYSQYYHA